MLDFIDFLWTIHFSLWLFHFKFQDYAGMSRNNSIKEISLKLILLLYQMGRIIYGIGGESLGVARSTFVSSWFRKQELGMCFYLLSVFVIFSCLL
jgi:hypothetical protein